MKFSHTHETGETVEYTIPAGATISDVLDSFVDFLRGCSYTIPYDQYLCLVSDDVETITDNDYETELFANTQEDMHDE